ncbi:MAG: transcription antitermination factor NusB [Edaphobacter sp.]|uniref:transcription antitermination factor NusB n=1 Tax=Edaphobacter sp. TaxID=1934404 RepID=UPI00238B1617|nr:transcription antitermination factor NusB [Edaphobacter sp.]MDE1176042.1 transcription antitermination factor NusB [Edaphobacter sp.]
MSTQNPNSKNISPARVAAFEILAKVAANQGNSDDLLHSSHTAGLSPEDRNLATTLVMGTLRWQIALDARIQPLLQRPDQRLAEPVAIALRLGAFQLLHLDRIPAHAALNESVELTRESGHPHAAGMVNAILRNLTRQKAPGRPLHESTAALAQRLSYPQWLVERWVAAYGRAAAIKICEAGQAEPSAPVLFAEDDALPRIDDGSRLVAELTAVASSNAKRIWDTCAAPGGKTLILARRYPEGEILATDISPRRLASMRKRFETAGATNIVSEQVDATVPPPELNGYDLVLCDVPCSGTGTLARNPEIRLRLTPADLSRHASRQQKILAAALPLLAPGGRLLYSTCSLEPEECERVVEAVMEKASVQKTVSVLPLQPLLDQLHARGELMQPLTTATRGNFLRTMPGTHPGDGFFAALFQRRT